MASAVTRSLWRQAWGWGVRLVGFPVPGGVLDSERREPRGRVTQLMSVVWATVRGSCPFDVMLSESVLSGPSNVSLCWEVPGTIWLQFLESGCKEHLRRIGCSLNARLQLLMQGRSH